MDKQKIIAGVNPKKRKTSRKDAIAKIREQSFNEAYQKNKEEEKQAAKEQTVQETMPVGEAPLSGNPLGGTQLIETPAKTEVSRKPDVEEAKPENSVEITSEEADTETLLNDDPNTTSQKTTAKKSTKKAKKKEGVGEITYATISVHQNVSKVVKLASTMLEANKLDFTTDAVRHYIKYLKKSGKLPDMPSLDL